MSTELKINGEAHQVDVEPRCELPGKYFEFSIMSEKTKIRLSPPSRNSSGEARARVRTMKSKSAAVKRARQFALIIAPSLPEH